LLVNIKSYLLVYVAYIWEGHKHSYAYLLYNFFCSALSSQPLTNYMDHTSLEKSVFWKVLKIFHAFCGIQRLIITSSCLHRALCNINTLLAK
jgi:hypothetical protein